ncbi:MAG: hypothetical protein Q9M92_03435 [Enterobacterales bacterium]|nr:hypothetical protein [Enterobacterales bacterium]
MDTPKLFRNLKALEDASFPKECSQCGTRFENEKDYIEKSVAYQKAPNLSECRDEQGQVYLKLIRNCHCGKPILDHFGDRRDQSKQGEMRRKAFDKVIKTLIDKGLTAQSARTELLNHMNNRKSPILEKLGIFKN